MLEITVNEKKVIITSKDMWTYNGISETAVKDLNEELFNTVQKEVEYTITHEEEIRLAKQETARLERYLKSIRKFEEFCDELTSFNTILKEYKTSIQEPNIQANGDYDKKVTIIDSDTGNKVTIEYNCIVYGSGRINWGSRGTKSSSPWVLQDIQYKNRRYAKLETAINSAVKLLDEARIATVIKNKEKNLEELKLAAMKKFAADNGFEFKQDFHPRSQYNSGLKGYYTYSMVKGNVTAYICYSNEESPVEIISYTVRKKGITVADLDAIQ